LSELKTAAIIAIIKNTLRGEKPAKYQKITRQAIISAAARA
jgi:hypothetical protein